MPEMTVDAAKADVRMTVLVSIQIGEEGLWTRHYSELVAHVPLVPCN